MKSYIINRFFKLKQTSRDLRGKNVVYNMTCCFLPIIENLQHSSQNTYITKIRPKIRNARIVFGTK
jgi:hypothetical protein